MLFADARPGSDHERLLVIQDAASGLRAVCVIHSTRRGPAFGGIRRRAYATEAEAVADVMALAGAMTLKCALAGLPAGGAKTVVLDRPDLDRPAAYAALGRAIDRLSGDYVCGPDVGTGEPELALLREQTRWVNPVGNDAGAATAAGVLAGIRGTLRHLHGGREVTGRRFAVEGLGSVGLRLATALTESGAEVQAWDVREEVRTIAARRGVQIVEPDALWRAEVDILVPSALGGCVTASRARQLRARAICGPANNQLAGTGIGALLDARDVAFVPDFVVSVGAVAEGVWALVGASDWRTRFEQSIEAIEARTLSVLAEARDSGRSPVAVAQARAMQALEHAE